MWASRRPPPTAILRRARHRATVPTHRGAAALGGTAPPPGDAALLALRTSIIAGAPHPRLGRRGGAGATSLRVGRVRDTGSGRRPHPPAAEGCGLEAALPLGLASRAPGAGSQ